MSIEGSYRLADEARGKCMVKVAKHEEGKWKVMVKVANTMNCVVSETDGKMVPGIDTL